jgi:hypothetical protein
VRGVNFLLIVSLLSVAPAIAQSPNATINGLVLDPSGAAIAGAEIIVVNDATNVQHETTTNSAGIYVVTNLPPGPYRIQVAKIGFKTIIKPDIVLNVQDALAINFTLPIGAVSEIVTVTGGAPLVNTQDAAVSTVVDRQFAENLPLNGRSFQALIYLTPGVVVVPSNGLDAGQFTVNGQRAASNYWMVDGVSANIGVSSGNVPGNGFGGTLGSFSAQGGTNSLVSVDALQEFRIQTSTYAPEFGRTPGGQISIVTRSGTNQFHGTAFDYFRNDVLDANDWFADYKHLSKPEERQNDFGGTFSGPIGKNRTFFFFSYEGLRLRLPRVGQSTVPDASFTPGGTTNSRQNAASTMQPYLNAFPLPNRNSPEILCVPNGSPVCPSSGITGSAAFNASFSNPATLDAYSLRIDHKLFKGVTLFGRYNYSPSESAQHGFAAEALSELAQSRITTQTATAGTTWVISPTVVNDLRFNYSRVNAASSFSLDNFGGAVPLASLPFPSPYTIQNAEFGFRILALTHGQLLPGKTAQNLQRQINIIDTLSLTKGSHALKFGVDFRRLSPVTAPPLYTQVSYFFTTPAAQMGQTIESIINDFVETTLLFRNFGAFAQDTWRIVPRATLTYGLRWDLDAAPSSLDGASIVAVTGYNLNDFSRLAIAPVGTPPFKTTYGNVAPRIGLAYQLNRNQYRETVLRGGFGVFYDLVSSEVGGFFAAAVPPFGANKILGSGTFPLDATRSAPPAIPSTGSISSLSAFNPRLKLPYTLEWNVALEQALGSQQTISASYIGASGRRLLQTSRILQPPSNPNVSGGFVDNTASSSYNALQVQFQRRLSHGLQVLTSYTWAHSIDDGSAGSIQLPSNAGIPGSSPAANRGPSDFDIRHTFSAGVTYDIPVRKMNAFTDAVLRGWSIQNTILARSAPPVDVTNGFPATLNGVYLVFRPDVVPGQPLYLYGANCATVMQALGNLTPGQGCPGGKVLNPNAFIDPPSDPNTGIPLRQGNVPRNFLRGFGATEWDFAVHRDFPIRESVKLQFRAEMFNVLNHPNFGQPSGTFGVGGFGLSSQTLGQYLDGGGPSSNVGGGAFSSLYQIGGPRSIQLALKLFF